MKSNLTQTHTTNRVYLLIAICFVMLMALVPGSRAGLSGLYTNDVYTLHLWHLQDTNGTIAGVATNGVYFYDSQSNNPLVVPLLISNTPGPSLTANTAPTAFDLAGQPGPGTGPQFQLIGTNFGYGLAVTATNFCGFFSPWDNIANSDYPDPSYAFSNNSCSFCNTNTGAFTWEALIQPNFNPLTYVANQFPEILCSDGPNNTGPNVFPYATRAIQFRLKDATPSTGQAQLEINNISLNVPSANHDMVAQLPTTGPDAVAQGTWYHVAVAYTGNAPTNGDPAHVLTFYWTKFDPTRTNADVLANFPYAFTLTNTATHAVTTVAYPSNSIVGTGPFVIGGAGRLSSGNMSGGWVGNIAEVRISDYYRHTNEFMFNTNVVPQPPLISGPSTNNLVGYNQTLNLSVQVSGSQPYAYQWYQNGLSVAGQTNASLTYSNLNYGFNTNTYYVIVTNGYGSTTSVVATVTVGANFDAFFNTGCGPNYNPLDQTAPGSVDLHWQCPVDPDTTATIPHAIIWSDAAPVQPNGVAPANGASVWIGPRENGAGGTVAGTYSFQTTFQVDEAVVTTNTSISGNVGVLAAAGGETLQMFLNGVESDIALPGNPAEVVYSFSITNGLQPGSNTLICTAAQTGGGTAGQNGFDLAVLADTGVALTNAPAITNQPVGVTNVYGSTVSFQAVALGAPPLSYYWLSNGMAITPPVWVYTAVPYLSFVATNFSVSQVIGTNYFANYQIVYSNFVGSVTSAVATLNVQLPPLTVASAGVPIWNLNNNETNIVVYFSGPVDPTTATIAANYTLTGGSGDTVISAVLGSAPGEVILTFSTPLNPATSYMLTVTGVNSAFGITMIPASASVLVGTYPGNVALWVKAGVGITPDGSGGVSQWNDLSTNNNNLLGAGGGYNPLLATNAYGYPVVRFNGTNASPLYSYLYANNSSSLAIVSNMSVFAVANFATLAGSTNGELIDEDAGANGNLPNPYDYYAAPSSVDLLRGNGSTFVTSTSAKAPTIGVPQLLDVVMQGTGVTHRLDGNTNGTGTINTPITDAATYIVVGARGNAVNRLTGDLQELILVGGALSASDVVSMENYLAAEYNMPTGTNSYPIITQEPVASATINQNATLTVPAVASGTPAVAYQWYDIGKIAQAGQTNATLVISNDMVTDSYYLVATNVYGTATSSVVAVTVISGLNVSLGPPTITLYTGQSAALGVAVSGTVPFYYQWYNGASAISGATNALYTATAVSGNTSYYCTVSNSYNGLTSTQAGPVTLTGIATPATLYQQTVLSNNPVAFWRLNEGPDNNTGDNGTIANDYVGGHNGTYTNVVLGLSGFGLLADNPDTATLFGYFNSSPSNSYVSEINNSTSGFSLVNFAVPSGGNGEFSVEAWVCSSNTQVSGAGIVSKGYGNGGEQFDLDVFGGFRFLMRDASGTTHGPTLSTAPKVGQWYHVVGVVDGANGIIHLYTNGVDAVDTTGVATGLGVLTSTTANTLMPQTALVSIGARASSQAVTNYDLQFQGNIQDVALYNYALSPQQVVTHYLAGAQDIVFSTTATKITASLAAANLTLSWPLNHTGWTLQAQTNSVSKGISANWANVSGSANVNQVVIPVNLTNGTVFYRLIYTP